MKNIVRLIALALACSVTNSFAMESDKGMKETPLASATVGLKTVDHEPGEMLCEGFPAGTLVKTAAGDVQIEQIKEGDQVYAYDFNGHFDNEFVVQVLKKYTDVLVRITADGETFFAAPDQRFLLITDKWIAAADLKVGDRLQRTGYSLPIDAIEAIEVQTEVYCPTITNYGNFCVSAHGFFAHNLWPFLIPAAVNVCVGAGSIAAKATTAIIIEKICTVAVNVAACVGTAYLGKKLNKSRKSHKNSNQPYCQKDPDNQSCDLTLIQAEDKPSCGDSNDCEDLHDPTKYTRQPDGTYISVSDATWWGKIFGSGQRFTDNSQLPRNSGGAKNNTHASRKSKIIKLLNCGGCGGQPPNDPKDPRKNGIFDPHNRRDPSYRKVQQLMRSRRSLEKRINEHVGKLAAYEKNPRACDNKGYLKNARTPKMVENIIKGRIKHLKGEIADFGKKIIKIDRDLADLGGS